MTSTIITMGLLGPPTTSLATLQILVEFALKLWRQLKGNKQSFQWTEANDKSFKLLKQKITKKHILVLPDFNKTFQVECDASGTTIGDVLSQEGKPTAYFSDKLNFVEQKYCSYDKELYAIV